MHSRRSSPEAEDLGFSEGWKRWRVDSPAGEEEGQGDQPKVQRGARSKAAAGPGRRPQLLGLDPGTVAARAAKLGKDALQEMAGVNSQRRGRLEASCSRGSSAGQAWTVGSCR